VSRYKLIEAEKTSFPVQFMCRMLGVSRSGYYGWTMRPPSARKRADAALTGKIREIHRRSRDLRLSEGPCRAEGARDPLLS
jgi:putative transposase